MPTFKPMPAETEDAIQATIKYVEDRPACGKCVHFAELDDPHQDRSWIPACKLFEATLGHMRVSKDGACQHYQPGSGHIRL